MTSDLGNSSASAPLPSLTLESGRTEATYWRDLWRYRELLWFLAWRDILVRYKQTALGIVWALLQPLLTTVVGTVVFGKIANLPTGDVPYPVLIYTAMLPWQFFASSLSGAANSLVGNANLISKVYFPRLVVPMSAVVTAMVDFLISALMLACLMAWFRVTPDWRLLTLPLFTGVAFATALGAGLWLTALNVKYRDFRYVVPFIVQSGLFISPVFFSSAVIPERWRFLYSLNPMAGVIDGFRWAILGGKFDLQPVSLGISLAIVATMLVSGVWFFRRIERTFADLI